MKTQPIINENVKPDVCYYNDITSHILQCKCGLMVETHCVEYNCPLCGTHLIVPKAPAGSRKTIHRTYNWFKHYQSLKEVQYQVDQVELETVTK